MTDPHIIDLTGSSPRMSPDKVSSADDSLDSLDILLMDSDSEEDSPLHNPEPTHTSKDRQEGPESLVQSWKISGRVWEDPRGNRFLP